MHVSRWKQCFYNLILVLNKWSILHMNTFCTSTISVTRVLQMIRQRDQRILSLIVFDNNAQLNPCFRGCSFVCTRLMNLRDVLCSNDLCPRKVGLSLLARCLHRARTQRQGTVRGRKYIVSFLDSLFSQIALYLKSVHFFLLLGKKNYAGVTCWE